MKIDMIMMSKFGKVDGGRETWFNNFLHEVEVDNDNIEINLYSLPLKQDNVVEKYLVENKIINSYQIEPGEKFILPLTIIFILKLCLFIFKRRVRSNQVVAVGSVNEMFACFLSYPPFFYKGRKIIWLRTISRREFARKTGILKYPLIFIEYILLKFYFDEVLTNGEDTGEFYAQMGVENRVINNGVNEARWFNNISMDNKDVINISFIGRLEDNKGIISFCNAIKKFNETIQQGVFFSIVGQGYYEKIVNEICKKEYNVSFINGLDNLAMPDFLKKMDVSVALTFSNNNMGGGGLSNALLEQMCAGNLIIAWDNSIFRQILCEENSILVEQGNEDALVAAFIDIYNNFSDTFILRKKSQELASKYSSNNNKSKFIEVLNEYH